MLRINNLSRLAKETVEMVEKFINENYIEKL